MREGVGGGGVKARKAAGALVGGRGVGQRLSRRVAAAEGDSGGGGVRGGGGAPWRAAMAKLEERRWLRAGVAFN